jgi:serine protease Do
MNKQIIYSTFLALSLSACAMAQTKDAPKEKKSKVEEEVIVINDGKKGTEKMTVRVDGNKVTINGKDIDSFKEGDWEKFGNKKIIVNMEGKNGFNMHMPPMEFNTEIKSNKAMLGVVTEKTEKGAQIKEVNKESPAAKAGLKVGDVITKLGDTKIESADGLYNAVSKYKPEEKVSVTYLRDGKEKTTSAVLGKNTSVNIRSMKMDKGNFDIRIPNFEHNFNFDEHVMKGGPGNVRIMSSNGRPKLGMQIEDLEAGDGVKVTDVDDELPAGKAGLKEDDIITEINGKSVKSVDELRDQIKDLKPGDALKLGLKRGGKAQTLELKIPKKLKSANL